MKELLLIAAISISVPVGFGIGAYWKNIDKPKTDTATQCYTFQSTGTSHIRLNSCTGEAHIVVRGPNGFEWQRIIE